MEKHQTYYNLLDAVKDKGCPICFLVKKSIHKMMDDFLYEQVNDPKVRLKIKAAFGFCGRHAWQLQKFGDGLGLCIIYDDLLTTLQQSVKEHGSFPKQEKICPFCNDSQEIEQRYVCTFIEYFDDVEFNSYFKQSFGLCLNHLISVLNSCRNKKIIENLKEMEFQKRESLIAELKEFHRKHDYRFAKEGYGPEGDSWIRAIEKLAGKDGVF